MTATQTGIDAALAALITNEDARRIRGQFGLIFLLVPDANFSATTFNVYTDRGYIGDVYMRSDGYPLCKWQFVDSDGENDGSGYTTIHEAVKGLIKYTV